MADQKCKPCIEKDKRISEQKEKFNGLQLKFREVVAACRTLQAQLKAKDAQLKAKDEQLIQASILAVSSTSATSSQDRVSDLENQCFDLSSAIAQHETQRNTDKKLIDDLYSQLETLQNTASSNVLKEKTFNERIDSVSVSRSRHVQTDPQDDSIDHTACVPKSLVDVDVQTDIEAVSNIKKPVELAVVIPTTRENKLSEVEDQENSFQTTDQNESVFLPSTSSTPPATDQPPDLYTRTRTISESASVVAGPSASSVSLFYANELARKEIELGEARLQAREFECGLRELQWKYNVEKYRLQTRVACLEKQQQAMQKESSNQPNLMYVKNVLLRYISSKDKNQKQVMINALLTALNVNESTNTN